MCGAEGEKVCQALTPAAWTHGLPGHPRHTPGPAPPVQRGQVGPQQAALANRTAADQEGDQKVHPASGAGEPQMGAPAHPRRSRPGSAAPSPPGRSGESSTPRASTRSRVAPAPPGASSSPPRSKGSSPVPSCTPTPCWAAGCTRWRSSSTAPAGCLSPVSPPTRPGPGPCTRREISPPTWARAGSHCASCCATAMTSTARPSTRSSQPKRWRSSRALREHRG